MSVLLDLILRTEVSKLDPTVAEYLNTMIQVWASEARMEGWSQVHGQRVYECLR